MSELEQTPNDTNDEFDLHPDPRVLPMLGEISVDQWRCIAELVDNAVDGFLNASRDGADTSNTRVDVVLPTVDKEGAQVRVIDNGHGMTPEVLQRAVRAGWSGNNPMDNLGLFGMGFNIATARLGSVTEVWTTRQGDSEWYGLEIDFDQLRRQRHFRTPRLRRPKADPDQHGTEVTIKRLKDEQRKWFAKSSNRSTVRKRLSQTYSSMLRSSGVPISFKLFINNKSAQALRPCTWNEERSVSVPGLGEVHAVMPIDYSMAPRLYCTHCMNWVSEDGAEDQPCLVCSSEGTVIIRNRRIKGWIGIQRYLHRTEFGFDFIRNGRKIEINNKDLFVWRDGETEESEYPIDDQRGNGRIVGEIHIDHCRVSYAKDRFDRTDPSWDEMVRLIRGEGPLRPDKAKDLGYQTNDSPLFQLFKAFRRSTPHTKTAGVWKRIMVARPNERAIEMATQFQEGDPAYQEDDKWWQLIEEAERDLLYGGKGKKPEDGDVDPNDLPTGFIDDDDDTPIPGDKAEDEDPKPVVKVERREVPSLSRKYTHQGSGYSWNVSAYEVSPGDPELPPDAPWAMPLGDVATRTYNFLFYPRHTIFRSMTMTPKDALLTQIAWMTGEAMRTSRDAPSLGTILAELRSDYEDSTLLDEKMMAGEAAQVLSDVANAMAKSCPQEERSSLFNDLVVSEQQAIMRALATRKIRPTEVTVDGSFLQYAPHEVLRTLLINRPEYCFDGKIWDESYETLDYGDQEITDSARAETVSRYIGLIDDVTWLARQDTSDLEAATREELIRARMSVHLLRPDTEYN